MHRILTVLILLLASHVLVAQQSSIRGSIADTANQKRLTNAVVMLVDKKDSTLKGFSRTEAEGSFLLKRVPGGQFLIIVTHPGFADYVDSIEIKEDKNLDLGMINLTNKITLLREVIIKGNSPIRIKGDTTEFTADSFAVSANANAEELLRRLPGIQVNKNGEIVAQGERVEKVLVDGEEFFSDDPTIATRNIRADAVDKVQVFDKKSEQAEFTGIDDGKKSKTINLKLKEDKKTGYFGKVKGGIGGGQKTFHSNEAMINAFKGKRKLSAFGTMDNTGSTGLGWQDRRNFEGNEDDVEFNENDGWQFNGNWDPFESNWFQDEGLPTAYTAGGHYSNKWGEGKAKVNANYVFKMLTTEGTGETRAQYILPDTLFYNNEFRSFTSDRMRNTIRTIYDTQLDSSSSLRFSGRAYTENLKSRSLFRTEALNSAQELVNRSLRNNTSDGNKQYLNANLSWRKKFKKKGRTFSARVNTTYELTDSDGFLNAITDFFTGGLESSDTIDQYKTFHNDFLQMTSKVVYTEPIFKDNFIEFRTGVSMINSQANRRTFDESGGKYETINPLLTNNYDFDILMNSGGLSYRIVRKKYNFVVGSDVVYQSYKQTNLDNGSVQRYYRTNLFPASSIRYNFKSSRVLGFNYNGETQQPTVQQVQPILDNTDPLNISIGNPDLKPAFNHRMNVFFFDNKVLKERFFYINGYWNLTTNAITSFDRVDSVGRKVYQSINGNSNHNWGFWSDYNLKLQKLKIRYSIGLNGNGGRFNSFVNGVENVTDNRNIGVNMRLSKDKEKKYWISLSSQANYNYSVSSIRPDVKTIYWTQEHSLDFNFELPGKTVLNSDARYFWREKTEVFPDNNNVFLWNASFGKKLFKEKALLNIVMKDILNQNRGFDRNISSNFISERRYTVIRRLWLVTFTYNFKKNAAGPAD